MRYWVYINDKVEGPFEEDKLVTLNGFTPDTLICAEDTANTGNQEWVQASSIFEFDQEPAQQQAADVQSPVNQVAAQQVPAVDNVTAMLLAKLDALTNQLSDMQHKINGMQSQLDLATHKDEMPATVDADQKAHSISLTRHDLSNEITPESLSQMQEETVPSQAGTDEPTTDDKPLDMLEPLTMESSPINETSEVVLENKGDEESIVSAALNSMYASQHIKENIKNSNKAEEESTFQDLLNPTQARELEEETKQKAEQIQANPQPTSSVTAEVSPADAEREALITALTSPQNNSTADNVVDQVIQEREADKEQDTVKLSDVATAAAAGAAIVAGAAALAGNNDTEEKKKEEAADASLDEQLAQQLPDQSGAANKEKVLPSDQMPPDVEKKEGEEVTIPLMDDAVKPHLEDVSQANPEQTDETLEELVPGAKMEKPDGVQLNAHDLNTAFLEKQKQQSEADKSMDQIFGAPGEKPSAHIPVDTAKEEKQPVAEQEEASVQQNLQTSPDPKETIPSLSSLDERDPSREEPSKPAPSNPDDLTEIELKEGSTYLISDFVPPAKAAEDELPTELQQLDDAKKTQTIEVEEMVETLKQTQIPMETKQEAPADLTGTQVSLENTFQSKRGATLDIKTVPMVPEPEKSERLNLEGLEDDINAQHDVKSADETTSSNSITKLVIGVLVVVLLTAVSYGMLAFMNNIPEKFNIFASGKVAQQQAEQTAQLEEMLPDTPAPVEVDPMQAALETVKNYPLANGSSLKSYIETKHASVKDAITWDISTAVDPDNYSVLIKVPPENPQSFKISYRFNFNTVTNALEPTISDAKNLMDEVGGTASLNDMASAIPATMPEVVESPVPAPTPAN